MSRFNEDNAHLYAALRAQPKPKGRNKGVMRTFRINKRAEAQERDNRTTVERKRATRMMAEGFTLKNGVWVR